MTDDELEELKRKRESNLQKMAVLQWVVFALVVIQIISLVFVFDWWVVLNTVSLAILFVLIGNFRYTHGEN